MIDTDNLFAKNSPAIGTNIATCGALTACDVKFATSADLEDIYTDGAGGNRVLGTLLAADFTGKAYGAKQNGFYDFFQAHTKLLSPKKLQISQINHGLWEVAPFIKMKRKRTINNEWWTARLVASAVGYNQTANIQLRVYSQSSIPADTRFFPAGMRVFVSGVNADGPGGDTAYRLQFKVISADATGEDGNGAYVTITVQPQNAAAFHRDDATAAIQNKSKVPEFAADAVLGLLVRGTPNVSDYESYCSEIPGLNNNQLLPMWIETTRYSICEDELTQKYLTALRESNPYFKEFGDVEQVELNKQIIEDFQKRHVYNLFFNKRISANQTLALWPNLDSISLPAASGFALDNVEGRCIGKRAHAVGFYEQLVEGGRVKDLEAANLDIRQLINSLYYIQRNREAAGVPSEIVEIYTDSRYAKKLAYALITYYKNQLGADIMRVNMQLNQGTADQGPFGFKFYRFNIDHPAVELRIVTHRAFDDMLSAHTALGGAHASAGRMIWCPDWTSMYQGTLNAETVTNTSGELKQLAAVDSTYMCVMKVPTRKQKLTSTTYTAVNETENTSFILENLSASVDSAAGDTDSAYFEY